MADVVVEAQPKTTSGSAVDSNSKTIAALAWLFSPISSLILILVDSYKKDKYIQFHAWESLVFGLVAAICYTILWWTCIFPLAAFAVTIVGVVYAFQGESWKLPLIGDWAEEQANKAAVSGPKAG